MNQVTQWGAEEVGRVCGIESISDPSNKGNGHVGRLNRNETAVWDLEAGGQSWD